MFQVKLLLDAGADAKVRRVVFHSKTCVSTTVDLDESKVKNELGYTAYDLSLRGGETGGNFVEKNFPQGCFSPSFFLHRM